jgi:hypothetical protein
MNFTSWPEAEKRAVVAAGFVLLIALILARWFADATLIALLLFPAVIYGIVSGKIQEFSAPGGWGAKFQQAAMEKVTPLGLTDCIENVQMIQKAGVARLKDIGLAIDKGKPVALTLELGRRDYTLDALRQYIETLRIADSEMVVLFLDHSGGLVATAEGATLLGLLTKHDGPRLINAIKEADVTFLRSLPGVLWQSITKERSNAEALQAMREANARTMVVVDSNKKPVGIVKRDQIMARLLVELAGVHGGARTPRN